MFIKDHAKLRYVQRVMKTEDVKVAQDYVKKNEFEVSYRLLEMLNKAELIYTAYAPVKGQNTYDYYVYEEFLIVTGMNKTELITLYDIIVDSNVEQNEKKIREYIKDIKRNINKINVANIQKEKQDQETVSLEFAIEQTNEYLAKLEQMRQKSIDKCKDQTKEIKSMRLENRELMTKILFGFKEFK